MKFNTNLSTVISLTACKGNKVPAHYTAEPVTKVNINGKQCKLYISSKTVYSVVIVDGAWMYTATKPDTNKLTKLTTYIAPVKEVKEAKAPKAVAKQPLVLAPELLEEQKKREVKIVKPVSKKDDDVISETTTVIKFSKSCGQGKHTKCNGTTSSMTQCICDCHTPKHVGTPAPAAQPTV